MDDEKLLIVEAEAAVKELGFAVEKIFISQHLPNTELRYFLNVTTCEGNFRLSF